MTEALAGTWKLDPTHSEVGFTVRHAGISKVRGKFADVDSTATHNGNTAEITTVIQADSFTTGNDDRDAHVKSADFLAVDEYPTLTFTGVLSEDNSELIGHLALRGVEKPLTLAVELSETVVDPFGNTRVGVEATGVISRKDFGLTWNAALEAGGVLVGDRVNLTLDLSFIRQDSPAS